MNFSNLTFADISVEQLVASLQDWWKVAGVDLDYDDDLHALSAVRPALAQAHPENDEPPQLLKKPEVNSRSAKPIAAQINTNYPSTLDAFQSWLAEPENLIEGRWASKFAAPYGSAEPELMIVSAMPDQNDGRVFADTNALLLKNMLRAIDCDSSEIFVAPLVGARPADGRISSDHFAACKHRMEHLIGLVRPRKLIFFGDTLAQIFFQQDLLTARRNKLFINHVSAKVDAIVTFHPQILIQRPEYKAEAWKDLQMLTRVTDSEV